MNGIIILNKPRGITSHKACKKVQKLTGALKAGHTGTLDPEAEGVLLVCINEATRISEYLLDLRKEYIATGILGISTDSHDISGEVTKKQDPSGVTEQALLETFERFHGEIIQTPPPFSAIRKDGQRLYNLARRGEKVEVPPRKVRIDEISLLEFKPPEFTIKVLCSKGTYVRTLINDIGEALGPGATLKSLIRTSVGPYTLKDACTFDDIKKRRCRVISIDEALSHFPALKLTPSQYRLASYGTGFKTRKEFPPSTLLRLQEPSTGRCFALGVARQGGEIKVEKVLIKK